MFNTCNVLKTLCVGFLSCIFLLYYCFALSFFAALWRALQRGRIDSYQIL